MFISLRVTLIILSAFSLCHPVAFAFRKNVEHGRYRRNGHHRIGSESSTTTRVPVLAEEPWLLSAAERTWEYFKKPYPPPPKNLSRKIKHRWVTRRFKARCGVERPNHGLPNAVRKAVLVPYVIEAYKKFFGGKTNNYKLGGNYKLWLKKESFDFSADMIKAAQMAVMFEVVGRQAEIGFMDDYDLYYAWRLDSKNALADYSNGTLTPKEREDVLRGTWDMYQDPTSKSSFPYQRIFEKVHDLELLRCWSYPKMEFKVKWLGDDIGRSAAFKLFTYAEQLIEATGDYLKWRPSKPNVRGEKKYDCKTFSQAGRNVAKAFELVRRVPPPKFYFFEDLEVLSPRPAPSLSVAIPVPTLSPPNLSFATPAPISPF